MHVSLSLRSVQAGPSSCGSAVLRASTRFPFDVVDNHSRRDVLHGHGDLTVVPVFSNLSKGWVAFGVCDHCFLGVVPVVHPSVAGRVSGGRTVVQLSGFVGCQCQPGCTRGTVFEPKDLVLAVCTRQLNPSKTAGYTSSTTPANDLSGLVAPGLLLL